MTAALDGGEWSAARPGRTLLPGKARCPFYRRLGGLQGRSGRAENLVPTGIRSRTVHPAVSRYIDWAIRPAFNIYVTSKNMGCMIMKFNVIWNDMVVHVIIFWYNSRERTEYKNMKNLMYPNVFSKYELCLLKRDYPVCSASFCVA